MQSSQNPTTEQKTNIFPTSSEIQAYQVNYKDMTRGYNENTKLGEGSSGIVYEGFISNNPEKLAIKYLMENANQGNSLIQPEIDIMATLTLKKTPYTIKLIGYAIKSDALKTKYWIGMPIAENGPLDKILLLPCLAQQYKIMFGIAVALTHMHNFNIIHCDIKAENVLVDANFDPILADFGSSQRIGIDKTPKPLGTPIFMAPECLAPKNTAANSKASDMFALGMTFCQILLRATTEEIRVKYFSEKKNFKELYDYFMPGFRIPIPSEPRCPKRVAHLIQNCWDSAPRKRVNANQVNTELSEIVQEDRKTFSPSF